MNVRRLFCFMWILFMVYIVASDACFLIFWFNGCLGCKGFKKKCYCQIFHAFFSKKLNIRTKELRGKT